MKNQFLLAIFIVIATLIFPQYTFAQDKASESSANIQPVLENKDGYDYRVKILHDYLNQYNSPLADYAKDMIDSADKYNLDWRLVAAISGVESTFGKEIPAGSYNGWGWGIYGDNVVRFKSWQDGIQTVSQGLREKYINKWGGNNIYEIGSVYASSPAWAGHVQHYLNDIQTFALNDPTNLLPLSL